MRSSEKPELVFDVETVAPEWTELDEPTRHYLEARETNRMIRDGITDTSDAEERAADRLALELGLARVVAIGMCNVATGDTAVLLEQVGDAKNDELGRPRIYAAPEDVMLRRWWNWMQKYGRVITANGRGYDGPVLMVRSAQLGIPCTRQLVGYRYDLSDHCDVHDVLSFWGALRGGYSVDYWCRRFGIESPKKEGVDGAAVAQLYRDGKMMEIAQYVARDVKAERAIYVKLRASFLHLFKGGPDLALEPPLLKVEA